MTTYKNIQEWVKMNYGFTVKTCWIAHVKEMCGLKLRKDLIETMKIKELTPVHQKKLNT